MRRSWLLCIGPLLTALVLAACGSSSSSSQSSSSSSGGSATSGGSGSTSSSASSGSATGIASFGTSATAAMQKAYAGYQGIESNLPTEFPPPKKGNFKIAFLNTLASQQVLLLEQQAAAAEVKRLGGTMIALNDNVDPNKQVSDLQQALNEHSVGIFVDPIDPGSLDPLIAKAKAQGVKFVGQDTSDTLGNPGVIPIQMWQGRDHNAYGDMKLMADLKPHARIALIGYAVPIPNIQHLMKLDAMWAKQLGLQVVANVQSKSDDAPGGADAAQGLISKNVDGIVCYTDTVCAGAASTERSAGQHPITIGIGGGSPGVAAVSAGLLTATPQFNVAGEGKQIVDGLYDQLEGVKTPPIALVAANQLVTKGTLGTLTSWPQSIADLKAEPSP